MGTERITSLACWRGPVTLDPISGGITNRNYVVRDGDRRYVVRICAPLPHLGINRRNEVACQIAAHAIGVAPAVVHHEDGILVSDFIDARTLSAEDLHDTDRLARLAELLRTLHGKWDRLVGEMLYFSPFQTVQTYAVTARQRDAKLPDNLSSLLDDARQLAHRMKPFTPVLCHNDLLAANILDDGRRLVLVDWEYGGIGNPLFDLAGISGNCGLSDDLERELLAAYRSRVVDEDLADLRILKTVSLLREALWAVIQTVASDIEFDYARYAEDNLHAYREARQRLDAS
jgi:thiamine kinase-like enzyme